MQKFCHNCGKQMQSGWKVCPFCETSLSSLSARPPEPSTPQANTIIPGHVDRENDDDSYLDRANNLSEILRGKRIGGLSVEIVKDRPLGETLGSVAAQGPLTANSENIQRVGPYAQVDEKTFLEEFRKEAGTSQPNRES